MNMPTLILVNSDSDDSDSFDDVDEARFNKQVQHNHEHFSESDCQFVPKTPPKIEFGNS